MKPATILLATLTVSVAPVLGEVINVPGDYATIQAAIDAAVDGDEIVIAPGVYLEDGIDLRGKRIVVRSSDGPEVTTVNATGAPGPAFLCRGNPAGTVLEGLTIRTAGESGVFIDDDTEMAVRNCIIEDNYTQWRGGGLYIFHANVTVSDCIIRDNDADSLNDEFGEGGGAFVGGSTVLFERCEFSGNYGAAGGGGFYGWGNLTFVDCLFEGNHAPRILGGGAARIASGGEATFIRCDFISNGSANVDGGAIFFANGPQHLINCSFVENHAGRQGGAIFIEDADAQIVNCLFNLNTSDGEGAALCVEEGINHLINVTVVDNQSGTDGGAVFLASDASHLAIRNSIVGGNGAAALFDGDLTGLIVSHSNIQGGYAGIGNITGNPLFTPDFRLRPGSPCIDAGEDTWLPPDEFDLDRDADEAEPIALDLDNRIRRTDEPGTPSACPEDVSGNGFIDLEDLSALLADFGSTGAGLPGDLDDDGEVGLLDLSALLAAFGSACDDVVDMGAFEYQDCNENGVEDSQDVTSGFSEDCNGDLVPDECQPDCNDNGTPDVCESFDDCNANAIPDSCEVDCNANGIPDECDIADGTSQDCNDNGVPDACDIAGGTSQDCDADGVPDECEPDCNSNGVADDCDIADGTSLDCNTNGVPDECEFDCNANGIPDDCDLADGTSDDCNTDGVPDECQLEGNDCNENGVPDGCDVADGTSDDCNANSVPDDCELSSLPVSLLVSDLDEDAIFEYDAMTGEFLGTFAAPRSPNDIAFGPDRLLYAIERDYHNVVRYGWPSGEPLGVFVSTPLVKPLGLDFGPDGDLFVSSRDSDQVLRFDLPSGALVLTIDGNGIARPHGIAFSPSGELLVESDADILRFDPDSGTLLGSFSTDATSVADIETGPDGKLYVVARQDGEVTRFDPRTGEALGTFIEGLDDPIDVTFGPNGDAFVPDVSRVLRFDGLTGELIGEFAAGGLSSARCITFDLPGDCNGNGVPDDCDFTDGTSDDCNANGIPDECDIAGGDSSDDNDNGIPDECE